MVSEGPPASVGVESKLYFKTSISVPKIAFGMQEARKYRRLFIQAWAPARITPDKWRKRKTEPIYAGFKNWEILTRFGHDSWCKNKLDPRNQKSHYNITGI